MNMEKAFIINSICNMLENIAFICGIVYASIHFNRYSLLWFLLMPLLNSVHLRVKKNDSEDEGNNNEQKV